MNYDVHPEMLVLARESRAYTQSELATAISATQGKVSKYESGLLRVSEDHLHKIAVVLDYPVEFFYKRERRYGFGSSCTYHRKRQSLPVNQLKMLLARINILRIQVSRLLDAVEIECENRFEHLDLDEFAGDVERIAGLVRNMWKLPPGPINNLVEAVEEAGGIVFRCSFGTNKLDAISQWLPGVPPIFFVNADAPTDRLRWTLAHEIGHVVMHRVPTESMEEEADRFAAELLMPEHEIAPYLTSVTLPYLAQLKLHWKVSIAALVRRAYTLGKITSRQYRTLFEQLGRLGYRTVEPNPLSPEEPRTLNELLNAHINMLGYELSELSSLLGLHEHELVSQYFPDRQKQRAKPLRLVK